MNNHGDKPSVTIVDYGLGNLFSVEMALRHVGAEVVITDEPSKVSSAVRLVLPGVGAFGDGMKGLAERGLIGPVKDHVHDGRPLLAICLGMQLLMSEGEEFGTHKGLDLIAGRAVRMSSKNESRLFKIPHVGWNSIRFPEDVPAQTGDPGIWNGTVLEKTRNGSFMYFVHSNIVVPEDKESCLAETLYGETRFCSVVRKGNLYGCQFHPERSAEEGLDIYRAFISLR